MSRIQKPEIIEAIQQAAQRRGTKRIAADLNKAPSTVYAELNPWGDRGQAKLGLEDAVEIMRMTGDVRGMALAAAELGYRLVPIDGEPVQAETAYPALAEVMAAAGDLAERLRLVMEDGEITKAERRDLFDAAAGIVERLQPFKMLAAGCGGVQ